MIAKHIYHSIEDAILSIDLLIAIYSSENTYVSHSTFVTSRGDLVSYFDLKDEEESLPIL